MNSPKFHHDNERGQVLSFIIYCLCFYRKFFILKETEFNTVDFNGMKCAGGALYKMSFVV